ncbi:MAG TPA: hypothetical protein VN203_03740, partial [Candidatus Acidoferrum sp.]|nr:hypothetical protein [Candidatus Acidoferrum sp.]
LLAGGILGGGPEDVAGREMASAQGLVKKLSLGSFAYSGGPEKDQPPGAAQVCGLGRALALGTFDP